MKILEAEIELREETRGLEQAREAMKKDEYGERATFQTVTQLSLQKRTVDVVDRIKELPNASSFGKEIGLLTQVAKVMGEASEILARPETGPEAIAAETEAIELLLQTRRIQPKGGGGGGSSPGGGGSGTTDESALAKIGPGADRDASIQNRDVGQATGKAGQKLPEEFRSGLDEYFNRLEGRSEKP